MSKLYRTKEITDSSPITKRALRYYDKIDLLTPTRKTNDGRRFYSEDDLLRLQQITTLKFMGFKLDDISNILATPNFNFRKSLQMQIKMLEEDLARLDQIINLMKNLNSQFEDNTDIDWEIITKMIEVMKMSEETKENWHLKYFSTDELQELEELENHFPLEYWETYNRRWNDFYKEVKENLHTHPESEIGMRLAKKCIDLADEVYSRSSPARKKLWAAYKNGITPSNSASCNQEIINYIAKATEKYKREQNRLS